MMIRASVAFAGCAAVLACASPIAAKEPDKVDANGEKLICQREADIGSLIPRKKRCYTKAEWDRIALAGRENATRIVQDGASRPTGQ